MSKKKLKNKEIYNKSITLLKVSSALATISGSSEDKSNKEKLIKLIFSQKSSKS
jgi:hypothetical protein